MNVAAQIRLLLIDNDGTLTDGQIVYNETDDEHKHFSAKDGLGIRLAQIAGIEVAVMTGRQSKALARRCKDLHITHSLFGVSDKLTATNNLLQQLNLQWNEVAVMGDDWNDWPIMEPAAISACPADAFPDFRNKVNRVMSRSGGDGAVREFIEQLLHEREQYDTVVAKYLEILRSY